MPFDLSAEDEARFWKELQDSEARMTQYRRAAAVNPAIATNLVAIHNAAPEAAGGVKLGLAQATTAGLISAEQAITAAMTTFSIDATKNRIVGSRPSFGHAAWDTLTHLAPNSTPPPEGSTEAQTRQWAQNRPNPYESTPVGQAIDRNVLQPALQSAPGRAVTAGARTAFGALQSGAQFAESALINTSPQTQTNRVLGEAQSGKLDPNANPATIAKSTTIGQQVADIATTGTSDQGSGFFPGGQAEVRRREAERKVRGIIPGSAQRDATGAVIPGSEQTATIGRLTALAIAEPNTTAYRVMSGAVDAGVLWYADPANVALKGLMEARAAKGLLVPAKALSEADMARVLRPGEQIITDAKQGEGVWRNALGKPEFVPATTLADEARALRRTEAGVVDAHRGDVIGTKAEDWFNKRDGQQFLDFMASDPSYLSIHNALGRKVAPEIVSALKAAKTPEAVREVMLGDGVLGTAVRSSGDISVNRVKARWDEARLTQKMPQPVMDSGWNTTVQQRINSVNNADAWLANNGLTFAERSPLVDQWAQALVTNKQDRYKALTAMWDMTRKSLVASGVPEHLAAAYTRGVSNAEKVGVWGLDRAGVTSDFGFAEKLRGEGYIVSDASSALQADGPMLLSEGLGDKVQLGDIRAMRRLTSKWGWLTGVKDPASARYGELRMPFTVVDHIQDKYLRPAATVRPALTLRLIGDEQFSIAANSLTSTFRHPIQHMMLAMHKSGSFDAMGRDFDELAKMARSSGTWDDFGKSLKNAYRQSGSHMSDPLAAEAYSFKTGDMLRPDKAKDPRQWVRGLAETEMNQLRNEPIAVMMAQGKTDDEIKAWLASSDEVAKRNMSEITGLLASKSVYDQSGKRIKTFLDAKDPVVLNAYLDSERARLAAKAGSDPDMLSAIAHNIVGKEEVTVANGDLIHLRGGAGPRVEADPFNPDGGASTWVGSRVKLPDGRIGVIANDAQEAGHSIVQIGAAAYDEAGRPSRQMLDAAERWRLHELSPQNVKYAARAEEKVGAAQATERAISDMRDHVVSSMFSTLYSRPSDYLSNSPVFRELYYKRMTELAPNLAPEEANKFLKTMQAAADQHTAGSVAQFLGSNRMVDEAIAAAGKADGTLTHPQLDDYARGWALDETKKVLYDASRRNQFFDIARIVFPFGQHWGNFVSRWTRNIVTNPAFARRAQLVLQGGRDLDPTGSGQGFFHVDPRTGKEVFTYPFSSAISRFLTGGAVSQDQNVPLQGLSMGLQPMPAVGWVASMTLGNMVPDQPKYDEIKRILQPYGSGITVAPWLSKIVEGIKGDPNSTRIYANTYMDILQTLAGSGKYGNSPEELGRMRRDASAKARIMTVYRGILQGVGPAAPSNDYHVATTQGDKMASALIKEYAAMIQTDPKNATANFEALYGDAMLAYTVGKTRSLAGGLDESTAFGDWERQHPKLFALTAAPDVAGYFAPTGTDLDLAVRNRQLATGQRKRLSGDEWQSAVNETIGNIRYYALRDAVLQKNMNEGVKSMNQAQRDYLAAQRDKIDAAYPVANPAANSRVDFDHQIAQLEYAIGTKELQNNDVAVAAKDYLDLRTKVLEAAKARGLGSLKSPDVADLRAYLFNEGVKIADHTPTFGRLWSRVLSKEVD